MSSLLTLAGRRNFDLKPFWHEVRITHAALTDADTSQVISLATDPDRGAFPTDVFLLAARLRLRTAFAGGSVSALVVKVGDAGADSELITNTSIFTGASTSRTIGAQGAARFQFEAAYAPIATFTSTDDNLVNLTAGDLIIGLHCIRVLPR